MGVRLEKVDTHACRGAKQAKRSTARYYRRQAKHDPENAQRKLRNKGWLS